jgi:dihydroorotate dehydrogenase
MRVRVYVVYLKKASGGIDSAETCLNFVRMGASAVQVSSAIQV